MFRGRFKRYWTQWERKLSTIAKWRASRIEFAQLNFTDKSETRVVATLEHPICIFDAPSKGSTQRGGSSKKLVIFIVGEFEFEKGQSNSDISLIKSKCAISFFRKVDEGGKLVLKLVDALHFDMEEPLKPTPFHPVFHVQRGNGLEEVQCRKVLHKITHRRMEDITLSLDDEQGALLNPYFRIPTPQLDLLSVVTLVVADYFCSSGKDKIATSKEHFLGILNLLAESSNLVRDGVTSRQLLGKSHNEGHLSAALWYPEHQPHRIT